VDRKPGGQDKPLADAVALLREQLEAAEARAEARAEGERARADALRDRLDVAQAELRQAADQARQEAQDAAEALLQAEAARKARGLVARLWDAWRRE
jgi:ABC-type sugar transport system substrate-binding protein